MGGRVPQFISSLDDELVDILVENYFTEISVDLTLNVTVGKDGGHLDFATAEDLTHSDMPNSQKIEFLLTGEVEVLSATISISRADPPPEYWFNIQLKPEDVPFLTVERWSRLSLQQKSSLWVGAKDNEKIRLQRFVLCDFFGT